MNYYTPSIEEFCIGFEYESLRNEKRDDLDGIWIKEIVSYNARLEKFNEYIVSNHIRVKQLDHEDIVECGWELTKGSIGKSFYIYPDKSKSYSYPVLYKDREIWIMEIDTNEYRGKCFAGTIRNKHELQRIMKMIGI